MRHTAQARKGISSSRSASANLRRRSRACFLSRAKRILRLGVQCSPPYEKSWQFDGWKTPGRWRRLNRKFCAPKRKYLGTRRRLSSLRLEAQEAISRANGCRCFQKKCAPSDVRTPREAIEPISASTTKALFWPLARVRRGRKIAADQKWLSISC